MSNFKWEFSHIIEDSYCFKNNVNQAKVIMGLSGNGDVMVQIYNENGDCMKEETVAFDNATGTITVDSNLTID